MPKLTTFMLSDPWYFTRYFTKNLVLASGLVAISTFNFAFDQQGFNATQAMDAFDREFGVCNSKGVCTLPATYLSLLNGLVYIGFAAGAWIGSMISDRYGRRMTIFLMSLWAMVAATVLVTSGVSRNKWQLLVGRILNYVYIGMELSSVPVYQSEVVPSAIRGLTVGSYQFSIGLGGVLITSICRGTSTIEDNRSWMIPYGLYYTIPTFIACFIWFIPESPRWLLMKDRHEEALQALITLRGDGIDMSPQEEMEIILTALHEEKDRGTYLDLFKGHNRRRTLVVIGIAFFFQATGNSFSSHFSAIFVKSLTNINPFNITIAQATLVTVTSFAGIMLVDRIGRRKLWLLGTTLLLLILVTTGGLGVHQPITHAVSQGIVATMLLFQMVFSGTLAPLYYTLVTEIPASRLRDKTVRLASTVNIVTIFVVSFTVPYLLDAPYADLGSQVGFIYGGMAFLAIIFGYFCIPELTKRSLEEVEDMFLANIPLRSFAQYNPKDNDLRRRASEQFDTQEADHTKGNEVRLENVAVESI